MRRVSWHQIDRVPRAERSGSVGEGLFFGGLSGGVALNVCETDAGHGRNDGK